DADHPPDHRPETLMTKAISTKPWAVIALLLAAIAVIVGVTEGISALVRSSASSGRALARNPYLDPGTSLHRPAPNFTLTDQFRRPVSLSEFKGKVVLLAFIDSRCTTICP